MLIEGIRDHGTAATLAAYGKGGKADKDTSSGAGPQICSAI